MSVTALRNRPDWAPWTSVLDWIPFRIDALGLVTLLGAEEVNACVGRLVRSAYLEYLPLLGAFVIAGNRFREKESGFNLYNITQGFHTTDLAPWLTRWMKSQHFEATRSFVVWTVTPPNLPIRDELIGVCIGFLLVGFLTAFTVLAYDWYGFANSISMAVSIVVRWYMVTSVRDAIDRRVDECTKGSTITKSLSYRKELVNYQEEVRKALADKVELPEHLHPLQVGWHGKPAKVLIIMSDAKAVTMMMPMELLFPPSPFIASLAPRNRLLYKAMRWVGWIAFAVHIVAIGMSSLATQLYTVALLVIPTVLLVGKFGCDDSKWVPSIKKFFRGTPSVNGDRDAEKREHQLFEPKTTCWIGSRLKAEVYEWPINHEFFIDNKTGKLKPEEIFDPRKDKRSEKRQHLYAWLQLSDEEQKSMDKWDLLPHERPGNKEWMNRYYEMKEQIKAIGGGPYAVIQHNDTVVDEKATAAVNGLPDPVANGSPDTAEHGHRDPNILPNTGRPDNQPEHGPLTVAPPGAFLQPDTRLETSPTDVTQRDVKTPVRSATAPVYSTTTRRHSVTVATPFRNTAFWMTSTMAGDFTGPDGSAVSTSFDSGST